MCKSFISKRFQFQRAGVFLSISAKHAAKFSEHSPVFICRTHLKRKVSCTSLIIFTWIFNSSSTGLDLLYIPTYYFRFSNSSVCAFFCFSPVVFNLWDIFLTKYLVISNFTWSIMVNLMHLCGQHNFEDPHLLGVGWKYPIIFMWEKERPMRRSIWRLKNFYKKTTWEQKKILLNLK